MVRAKIYKSSYDGCNGWTHWLVGEVRFNCKDSRLPAAKARLTKRLQSKTSTYDRVSVEWSR